LLPFIRLLAIVVAMLKDELFSRISVNKIRLEALSDGVFAIVIT
jgi:hypothetical protein